MEIETLVRKDLVRELNNVICVGRDDVAFTCTRRADGWEIMTHVIDVTQEIPIGSLVDREGAAKIVGRMFQSDEATSFSKSDIKNAITVRWMVDEKYDLSPASIKATSVRLTDIFDAKIAERIINGEHVPDVSVGSQSAFRELARITNIVQNKIHTNRLEWHQNKIAGFDVKGQKIEKDELLQCFVTARFWAIEANAAAARLIIGAFGGMAILYTQAPPERKKAMNFRRCLETSPASGVEIDFSSKRKIRDGVFGLHNNINEIRKLSIGISFLPSRAQYSVNSPIQGHWNHDVKEYTSFTNTSTRYVDIVVQRQIIDVLSSTMCVGDNLDKFRALCEETNKKLKEVERNARIDLARRISFNVSVGAKSVPTRVFVKSMTVEKHVAFLNLECCDPVVKYPIATVQMSKKECSRKSRMLEFDTKLHRVKLTFPCGTKDPLEIGLMSELFVSLEESNGVLIAKF